MARYRKRALEVDAHQMLTGGPFEPPEWLTNAIASELVRPIAGRAHFEVVTLEGVMIGKAGDYCVRGIKGELYPVDREIFEASYDPVTGPAAATLTFGQFSAANRARCESPVGFNHPLHGWSRSDWLTAMVGELGEAANIVKKLNRVRDGVRGNKEMPDELKAKLRRELGDTGVYLDLLCQACGFTLAEAMVEVFNSKSDEIGYPGKLAA